LYSKSLFHLSICDDGCVIDNFHHEVWVHGDTKYGNR
jgi:hypothetical protein